MAADDGEYGAGQYHDSHHPVQDHTPQVEAVYHLLLRRTLHIQTRRRVSTLHSTHLTVSFVTSITYNTALDNTMLRMLIQDIVIFIPSERY